MTTAQTNESDTRAREQAQAQYESIVAMVERLLHCEECDGEDCDLTDAKIAEGINLYLRDGEKVTDEQRDDYHNDDKAREVIREDPLSVEVRSGWVSIGDPLEAEEFCILLCTGGPAVRIVGEMDEHGEPHRAWIEYQDWGTPWTQWFGASRDVLLRYCREFYYSA